MGFVLSLCAGFGAAALKESSDPSVRSVNDVRRLLRVAPLAAVPLIVTEAEARQHRRRSRYTWIGSAVTVILIAAAVHLWVRPLDIIWLMIMHRFGL
jgi:hypothetical protein